MSDAEKDIQPEEEDISPVFDPHEREDLETLHKALDKILDQCVFILQSKAYRSMEYPCWHLFDQAHDMMLEVASLIFERRSVYRRYIRTFPKDYKWQLDLAKKRGAQ